MATRLFHWSDVNECVMHETDGSGNTIVTYTHEPGPFGPLLSENRDAGWTGMTVDDWSAFSADNWGSLPVSSPTEYYHHYDALGSTTMLTDDSGDVTDLFTYDAWGNVIVRSGATATPYQWVGRWGYQSDAESGNYYAHGTIYQPRVARWITAEPSGGIEAGKTYTYLQNSPMANATPLGRWNLPNWAAFFVASANFGLDLCTGKWYVSVWACFGAGIYVRGRWLGVIKCFPQPPRPVILPLPPFWHLPCGQCNCNADCLPASVGYFLDLPRDWGSCGVLGSIGGTCRAELEGICLFNGLPLLIRTLSSIPQLIPVTTIASAIITYCESSHRCHVTAGFQVSVTIDACNPWITIEHGHVEAGLFGDVSYGNLPPQLPPH